MGPGSGSRIPPRRRVSPPCSFIRSDSGTELRRKPRWGDEARGGLKRRLIKREALTQVAVRVGERRCVALVLARASVAGSRRSACGRASARSRPRPRPRPSARMPVPHSPQRVHRPPQRLGQPPDKNNIHLKYSAAVVGRVDRFNKVIIYRQKYFK